MNIAPTKATTVMTSCAHNIAIRPIPIHVLCAEFYKRADVNPRLEWHHDAVNLKKEKAA
jgi:hypothetical protein